MFYNIYYIQCLNKDGVTITLDVTYQYKARPNNLRNIIMDFRDFDGYKEVLRYSGKLSLLTWLQMNLPEKSGVDF